jgi:hypothetical protein
MSLVFLYGAEDASTRLLVRHASESVETLPGADEHLLEYQRAVPRILFGDLIEVPERLR